MQNAKPQILCHKDDAPHRLYRFFLSSFPKGGGSALQRRRIYLFTNFSTLSPNLTKYTPLGGLATTKYVITHETAKYIIKENKSNSKW
jgi:hypothetical protein